MSDKLREALEIGLRWANYGYYMKDHSPQSSANADADARKIEAALLDFAQDNATQKHSGDVNDMTIIGFFAETSLLEGIAPSPKIYNAAVATVKYFLSTSNTSSSSVASVPHNESAEHWKANHNNLVRRLALLLERPDLPVDRISAYQELVQLQERLKRHELQSKSKHPAPCARYCEAKAFEIEIRNLSAELAKAQIVVGDLSVLVRQLVRALSGAAPDHRLLVRVMDYLQRKGLQGSPLRSDAGIPVSDGWIGVNERMPEVKTTDRKDFFIACRRAHNQKTHTLNATYLNGFHLYADEGATASFTGWYKKMLNAEFEDYYEPIETEGDVVTHWMELPPAPTQDKATGSKGVDL
ncbi:DUF551 domain-containing protein [Glaciimonas sp. PCH181]|uniref:DUF551 domain-containing protein n=1 Tax=Glaciimonas sp. PCH181 TaxID=2133943 RepID=UPI000D359BE4|nr:DUF551 domain-containing protein [Glaciimonas sp. PCH181]PUA17315.1 hypothetical protein C7W93_15425 [Glaciimonas sp. PCH181]